MADRVPPEVLEYLFLQVDNPFDLFNLRAVCKQWHVLITNERFLNMYFHNRFGIQSRQPLNWIICDSGYPLTPYYNTLYAAPKCLEGSGSVVLKTRTVCRAAFPVHTYLFNNHDYSIGIWLRLSSCFETVEFKMRFSHFTLKCILDRTCFRVFCSHAGGLQAYANIRVPLERWFHIVLTYSSKFQLYINGRAYSLICTEGPLSENQMSDRTMFPVIDGHLNLVYEGYIKYNSAAGFADIQILPCALTLCEIHAITKQRTCIEQLNMGRYLLDHWSNIRRYSKYLSGCILF